MRQCIAALALLLPGLFSSCTALADHWQPVPGLRWQIQFSGTVNTGYDVDVYAIDMFESPQRLIDTLHEQNKKVICYVNAGTWESWRPDAKRFPASVLGKTVSGWAGEKWLDIRQLGVLKPIVQARMALAARKQCDAVYVDNVDGYTNKTGFALKAADQLAYNQLLAAAAHSNNIGVGLNNDLQQIDTLVHSFDFSVNEACFDYHECDYLTPFVRANKAVFQIEYDMDLSQFCPSANRMGFSSIKKLQKLGDWMRSCH